MKKFLAILILPIMLVSCSGGGYGTSNDDDFSIKPDSLTAKTVEITSHDIQFDGNDKDCNSGQCYAVIYHGTINETEYVGIAVSDDPSPEHEWTYNPDFLLKVIFNLKIFFPAATITDGATFDNSIATSIIKVKIKESGLLNWKTYQFGNGKGGAETVTITVVLETEGDDYTTYRITAGGTVTLENIDPPADTKLLDLTGDIIAIKY